MPNAKTTLRVAMAAVAAPGIIAGMAAPAAHAAELSPDMTSATHSAEGNLAGARHTSLDEVQQKATSAMDVSSSHRSVDTAQGDLTGSNLLDSANTLNDRSMDV